MDAKLKKMVGQMLMAGFPSTEVDEQAVRLLEDYDVGNYIYFSRNMKSAEQVARLSKDLSDRVYRRLGICPFISADQEGGAVSRITEGAALMPGAMAVAAATDGSSERSLARMQKLGENCGQILRSVGVNLNLAPDMDVNIEPANPVIGARSYGDDPEQVATKAIAMMHGLEAGGVLPVIKHFPGHGNVSSDSHLGMPVNETDRERLEKTEFAVFQKGIQAGAKAVMTAHVRYTQVDPDHPATLSKVILTDMLRGQFHFDGLVMTDCLEMDAIRAAYGSGEGAVRAIEAGVDLLTVSHTYEALSEVAEAIYQALDSGRLSEERIQLSYDRIMKQKTEMGLLEPQVIDETTSEKTAMAADKLMLCREIAADSMTLLSGSAKLDLEHPDFLVIAPDSRASTGAEDMKGVSFADRAAARFGCLAAKIPLDGDSTAAGMMLQSAVKMGFKKVILGLFNARLREGQVKVLRELEDMPGVHLTVALLGAPYDCRLVQRADGIVCAYEYTALSVEALLDALSAGEFPGVCPVKTE